MNKEILVEIIREASKLGRLISGKELEEKPLKLKASKIEKIID